MCSLFYLGVLIGSLSFLKYFFVSVIYNMAKTRRNGSRKARGSRKMVKGSLKHARKAMGKVKVAVNAAKAASAAAAKAASAAKSMGASMGKAMGKA